MRIRTGIAPYLSLVVFSAVVGAALLGCDRPPTEPESPTSVPLFGKTPPAPAAQMEVLPALSGLGAEPADITDAGVVVGRSAFTVSPALVHHAVRWTRPIGSAEWRIEDLHGRLPSPQESQANKANEDGLIIGYMEIGGVSRGFVLPVTGAAIDLGPSVYASDLSSSGEITGSQWPTAGGSDFALPLYWAGPGAVAEALPPLEAGQSAEARLFAPGGAIFGVGSDAAGQWMVLWTRGAGGWSVKRLQPYVPKGPLPHAMNAFGQAIGYGCPSPASCDLYRDRRPFYWSSLTDPAIALPTLENRSSTYVLDIADTGLMAGFDNVRGSTTTRPLAWPSPYSVISLLPKGTTGGATGVNGLGQIVGTTGGSGAVVWTLP